MSLDLYRILEGLQIEDASGATNTISAGAHVSLLQGTGLPGGDFGAQDASGIGSLYLRRDAETDNLQVYYKWSTVNNTSADWKTITSKEYVDALANGISWREPALVLDNTAYANIAAAETAANVADTVNGVTISAGVRLLFTNLTTGNKNVYIVSGSTGNWTFTEDTNTATDGDALMIQSGTWAETQWVNDGTQWVQFGSATSSAELSYIRAFIGKSGPGSELPTFSSTNLVINSPNPGADNLESAVGKLDAGLGTGNIANVGGNWSISDDLAFSGTSGAAGTITVTTALDNINDAIGDRTYTNDFVVTDGEAVSSSIDALDTAVGALQSQSAVFTGSVTTTPASLFTVDTIPLASADQVKWLVEMRSNTTPANRRAFEIHAITDGTLVDFSQAAVLKLGSGVTGAAVDVIVSGSDLVLQLAANANYDYVVRRIAYSHF